MSLPYRTLKRLFVVSIALSPAAALLAQPTSQRSKSGAEVSRVPNRAFESLRNRVSNVDFYTTNYGIFGLDVQMGRAGVQWPRGSENAYIFGMGLWFGAKRGTGEDAVKLVAAAYDPSSGRSHFVPGPEASRLDLPADHGKEGISGNRIFNSLDYDRTTGRPLDPADGSGPGWPIWMEDEGGTPETHRYFGARVDDLERRNTDAIQRGPAVISDEDIVTVYRDNDLDMYDPPTISAGKDLYPIGLRIEESVYSWETGPLRDAVAIAYTIINTSNNDLYDCYAGPMLDIDIGLTDDDRTTMIIPNRHDDTLELAAAWSEPSQKEGSGYLGIDLLETPAVSQTDFVRRDKAFFDRDEQLGGATFRAWTIEMEPNNPAERYDLMSSQFRDLDFGPGDKRVIFTTGPFNMKSGDTVRVVAGLLFANGKGKHPTGSPSDMSDLIELDRTLQEAWDNGMQGVSSAVESPIAAGLVPRCSAVYPNPVSGSESATILYDLPRPSDVTLRLFDPIGREIDSRDLGSREGAGNSARIDCTGLASGMYLYEIRTSDGSARGTLTVTR